MNYKIFLKVDKELIEKIHFARLYRLYDIRKYRAMQSLGKAIPNGTSTIENDTIIKFI